MARNGTYSSTIEKYFKDNPGKVVGVNELVEAAKCSKPAVSAAISYLNKKARMGKGGLVIVNLVPAKAWQYNPDANPAKPARKRRSAVEAAGSAEMRRLSDKLAKPVPDWAQAEQHFRRDQTHAVIRLVHVGQTTEGYAIGKDEDTGNVFKVVPV